MSLGRSSNQIRIPNKSLVFLARALATTLQILLTWQKKKKKLEISSKEEDILNVFP